MKHIRERKKVICNNPTRDYLVGTVCGTGLVMQLFGKKEDCVSGKKRGKDATKKQLRQEFTSV